MKVRILDGTAPLDGRLHAHLQRRLDFALSGFADRIRRIVVRLSDGAPPRPGPVARCEIEVVLNPRSLSVADSGADLFVAVENTTRRLKSSILRALERERAWSPQVPSPPALRRRAKRK